MGSSANLGLRLVGVVFALFIGTNCTRKMPEPSHLRFQLPTGGPLSQSKISALTVASGGWALPDPSTIDEIVCYAVLVEGPEASMKTNSCTNIGGTVVIQPGVMAGAFVAGSTVQVDVPSGPARRIALVGFAATSASACTPLDTAGGPNKNNLSAPQIISEVTMDLNPGTVDVNMVASLNGATKFDACSKFTSGGGGSLGDGLAILDVQLTEGASSVMMVTLTGSFTLPVTVNYTSSTGNASLGGDYAAVSGSLSFGPGVQLATIPVGSYSDSVSEGNEFYTVILSGASGAPVTKSMGIVTINDDDAQPALYISNASITEGGTLQFQLSLSSLSSMPVTFNISSQMISASLADLATTIPATFVFPANQTFAFINVATVNDLNYENSVEIFNLSLSNIYNATVGVGVATGSISDNDPQPNFVVSDATATEGSPLTFTVSLLGNSALPASVNYSLISATAVAGVDYTNVSGTLSFAPGSHAAAVVVPTIQDAAYEGAEALSLLLSLSTNASISDASGSGTINDNDVLPTLQILDTSIAEGSTLIYIVSLNTASGLPVGFNYSTFSGTATTGTDYIASSTSVTILPGSLTTTISVTTNADAEYENNETVGISLTALASANPGDLVATGTILNNDPVPSLMVYDASIAEGSTFYFLISISAPSGLNTPFNFTTVPGSALAGTDYVTKAGIATILAGSYFVTMPVATIEDSIYEGAFETMALSLSSASNATIADYLGVGAITENDATPTLGIGNASVTEGGIINLPVTLSAASGAPVVFTWQTLDGSATAADYGAVTTPMTYTITAGTTSINLGQNTWQDVIQEGNETYTVSLGSVSGANPDNLMGTATIIDDDTSSIFIADASMVEGGTAVVTVSLNIVSSSPVTFQYITYDQTAFSPSDFPGISIAGSGSISIGALSAAITLTSADDALFEGPETFAVSLFGISGANTGRAANVMTITDNDIAPILTILPFKDVEGGTLTFIATLSSASGSNVTFNYSTPSGSATVGVDFTNTTGIATINAGGLISMILIPLLDDTVAENVETLTLAISSLSGVASIAPGSGVGYIADNDGWMPWSYLKAANNNQYANFGSDVSLDGPVIAVAAPGESCNQTGVTNGPTAPTNYATASGSGAAYVFAYTGTTWEETAYLKPANTDANDVFGSSISYYMNRVAVGARQESSNQTSITNGTTASANNSVSSSGAVYVFAQTGSTWAQEAYVKAANAQAGDQFGTSVALGYDILAVGSFYEDGNQTTITPTPTGVFSLPDAGAVYIYRRAGVNWAPEAYLKAPNANIGDSFGKHISVSRDTIVVGVPDEDSNQTVITNGTSASADNSAAAAGAAYVFRANGSTWHAEAYLKAANANANDKFGESVSIDGDTIVVGAPGEASNQVGVTNGSTASVNNSLPTSGAAYVFKRTGSSWVEEAYLKAPYGAISHGFGGSVAISGDRVVVGAPGDNSGMGTVFISGFPTDTMAVGSGAVHSYVRSGSSWSYEAYIKAPNTGMGDMFGKTLALTGDLLSVGSPLEDSNQSFTSLGHLASTNDTMQDSGAAYMFFYSGPVACTIEQAGMQSDPAGGFPINFMIHFSRPINPASFNVADINWVGTATGITASLSPVGVDNIEFQLQVTAGSASGTYIPTLPANAVDPEKGAGSKVSSPNFDNTVTY